MPSVPLVRGVAVVLQPLKQPARYTVLAEPRYWKVTVPSPNSWGWKMPEGEEEEVAEYLPSLSVLPVSPTHSSTFPVASVEAEMLISTV